MGQHVRYLIPPCRIPLFAKKALGTPLKKTKLWLCGIKNTPAQKSCNRCRVHPQLLLLLDHLRIEPAGCPRAFLSSFGLHRVRCGLGRGRFAPLLVKAVVRDSAERDKERELLRAPETSGARRRTRRIRSPHRCSCRATASKGSALSKEALSSPRCWSACFSHRERMVDGGG